MGVFIGILMSGCVKKEAGSETSSYTTLDNSDKKEELNSNKDGIEPENIALSNGVVLDYKYKDRNIGFQMMALDEVRYGMPIDSNFRFNYGGTDRHPECEFMIGPYKYFDDIGSDATLCDLDAIKGPEDILDNMAYKIPKCFKIGIYNLQDLTKESEEKITIGGFDAVKWKGEITCSTSSTPDTFAYVAYGFIGSDGRPYLFAGTDFTKERKQMDFMEEAWEGMLSTFVENPLPEGIGLKDKYTWSSAGEWRNY